MKTFALACVGTFAAAANVDLNHATVTQGAAGADGWTPFFSGDFATGKGDIETFQALDEKYASTGGMCGAATSGGGYAKAVDAQCRTVGTHIAASATGETVTCDTTGFSCLKADNQKCYGADAACAAANAATGVNNNGLSNKEDMCKEASACQWGCSNYEVRFKCNTHYTAQPTSAPTPEPTMAPTVAPTQAPTPFPTPAPSPRGAFAAGGIELIPSVNRIEHHDMESCQEAFAHTWRKNQDVSVECTANDDAVHITSNQASSTPGVITNLHGSHNAGGSDIVADQWYVVIVKGKTTAPSEAYPYMRCANAQGQRKNILWKTGTAAKATQIGHQDGYSISYVKESTYTKNCEFGALFTNPKVGSKMFIDYTEVRPLEPYEVKDVELEVGSPSTPQGAFPEHLRGRLANGAFKLGSLGWLKNDAATSSLYARGEFVAGEGSKGAVLREDKVPVVGKRNGIVQQAITVVAGQKYKFSVVGQFTPGANTDGSGSASLYVGDSSGTLTTNVVWNSRHLSNSGMSTVSAVFTAPSNKIEVGVLSVKAQVGNRIVLKSADLHVFNPQTEDDENDHAHTVAAVNAQTCDCDPAVHPSLTTRCEFTVNPADPKRHHVLKVTHQKESMGHADFHQCGDVSTGAIPKCKCCDCLGGAKHEPGYDINTLKNAQDFMVKFNDFTSDAGDIKPGMTGKCRYVETSTKHWCCQCTEGNCGKGYGDEVCYAHDETPGHGINFWGRNYEFKTTHHGKPTFQNERVSNDDTFTVTSITASTASTASTGVKKL